jgi:membrane protein DedA with SNARE-associated domain
VLTAVTAALSHAALSSGTQPALPGFLNSLSSPLEHFGLWAVLLLVLVEDFGIPVPGETVLIAASIYAGSGRLNVVAVGLIGFFAAVAGDNIGYAIGRFGGRALVGRWGKYVFLTPERLDKAEDFFDRQGAKIITVARFIEGLRQANGLIAGITHMHWLRFIAFNALGAALWVGTWVSVGYFAGQNITTIYNAITTYSLYAAIAAVVAIAALVFYRLRKRKRRRAEAVAAQAAGNENGDAEPTAANAPGTEAAKTQAAKTQASDARASDARAAANTRATDAQAASTRAATDEQAPPGAPAAAQQASDQPATEPPAVPGEHTDPEEDHGTHQHAQSRHSGRP